MHYELNVCFRGRPLFDVSGGSILTEVRAREIYDLFNDKFPSEDGYAIEVIKCNVIKTKLADSTESDAVSRMAITKHAVERFVERCEKIGVPPPKDPEANLRKLLREAEPCELDTAYKIERIINNGFAEAKYMCAQGWRFILSEDGGTLVTVERVRKDQN